MLSEGMCRLILNEYAYRPFQHVLTLGYLREGISKRRMKELFQEQNIPYKGSLLDYTEKTRTKMRSHVPGRMKQRFNRPLDKSIWENLGIPDCDCMDISPYEQANIVHDLNYPVPEHLHENYDLIIDNGTFDHLFDVKTCFQNVFHMLKPDGRIIQWNAASNFVGYALLSFSPELFYDYYVANNFVDCDIYLFATDTIGQRENWELWAYTAGMNRQCLPFSDGNRFVGVIVVAEKGMDSTCDVFPTQGQYARDEGYTQRFRTCEERMQRCKRQLLYGRNRDVLKDRPGYMHLGYV